LRITAKFNIAQINALRADASTGTTLKWHVVGACICVVVSSTTFHFGLLCFEVISQMFLQSYMICHVHQL